MVRLIKNIFSGKTTPRVEFKTKGRGGFLVYIEESREYQMEFEMSGSDDFDILAYSDAIDVWSDRQSISNEEKEKILYSFKEWAKLEKFRVQW